MKKVIIVFLSIINWIWLFGQEVPKLNESELIQKNDLKKNVGWMKLKVDSNFMKTDKDSRNSYEYYMFFNLKGHNVSMFKNYFPKKYSKVKYIKTDPLNKSKLLNGSVEFYNKKNILIKKLYFNDGFYVRGYYFFWGLFMRYKDKLRGIEEDINSKTQVEINYLHNNRKGIVKYFVHVICDGYKEQMLPYKKIDCNLYDSRFKLRFNQNE